MTRRKLTRLLLAGAAGSVACSPANREILIRLGALCEAGDFAIVGARLAVGLSNTLVPAAISAAGADVGQLWLGGSPRPPHLFSLGPDGAWVAWVPENSLPDPYGRGGQPVVCFTDSPRSARAIAYRGWFAQHLALSSGAERLAVVTVDRDLTRHLLVLKPATGETESDLTALITRFDLRNVQRLRLSASGERLVIGSAGSLALLDLAARSVLYEGDGRCACVAPSGEEMAFVDPRGKLTLVTIATGVTKRPLGHGTAYGVGSWTPDGSLLLALVRRPFAFDGNLVAIDCGTGRYADIAPLEEWNLGSNCALVKRKLLSTPPSRSTG